MVKSELIQKITNQNPSLLKSDVVKIVDIIFLEITNALCSNKFSACEIRGFGRFSTKIQKSRVGRNPATGTQVNLPQKRVLKWKASKVLLKRLNENFTDS